MTATHFIYLYCDGLDDCTWRDDPAAGGPNETVNEMVRSSGWTRRNGRHLCNDCRKHAESEFPTLHPTSGVRRRRSRRDRGHAHRRTAGLFGGILSDPERTLSSPPTQGGTDA